jgi:protein SCO1/2
LFGGSLLAHAGSGLPDLRLDPAQVLKISEAALGRELGSYVLTDSDGRLLRLEDYRGRPLVISLVYTSCSSVCPTTTQHLIDAVGLARRVLGERFAVLTIGFDARSDTPARLLSFARAQGIRDPAWRLASADESTLAAVMADLGFSYTAIAGGFDHISQTSIIDAEGRIYRHVYGDDFPLQVFVEPLKELVFGTRVQAPTLAAMIDRIKFLCAVYDPKLGRYKTSYAMVIGFAVSALAVGAIGWALAGAWRRTIQFHRRSKRARRFAGWALRPKS